MTGESHITAKPPHARFKATPLRCHWSLRPKRTFLTRHHVRHSRPLPTILQQSLPPLRRLQLTSLPQFSLHCPPSAHVCHALLSRLPPRSRLMSLNPNATSCAAKLHQIISQAHFLLHAPWANNIFAINVNLNPAYATRSERQKTATTLQPPYNIHAVARPRRHIA